MKFGGTVVRMLLAGRKALRRIWLSIGRFIRFVFKRDGRWWIVLVAVTVAFGVGLSLHFWELLHDDEDSLSTTISNLSFVFGGIVAIELALWRSIVGERQTTASQQQAETAQRDLLNQQFQKGAEMLGSSVLSIRLGGIYALKHLAVEHSEQYHVQSMQHLCAFIRSATRASGRPTAPVEEFTLAREELLSHLPDREDAPPELKSNRFVEHNDIQEALNAIAFCHDRNIEIETRKDYWLDLRGADLRGTDLSLMNLSRAPLRYDVSKSLYHMWQIGRFTDMRDTKLDDVSLLGTNLANVNLSNATGLTQTWLGFARIEPNDVPKLDGVVDANTGRQIVWPDDSSQDE